MDGRRPIFQRRPRTALTDGGRNRATESRPMDGGRNPEDGMAAWTDGGRDSPPPPEMTALLTSMMALLT